MKWWSENRSPLLTVSITGLERSSSTRSRVCSDVWVGNITLLWRFILSKKSLNVLVSGFSGWSMWMLKSPNIIGLPVSVVMLYSNTLARSVQNDSTLVVGGLYNTYKLMLSALACRINLCISMESVFLFVLSSTIHKLSLKIRATPPPMWPLGLGYEMILYPSGGICLIVKSSSSGFNQVSITAHISRFLSVIILCRVPTLLLTECVLTCEMVRFGLVKVVFFRFYLNKIKNLCTQTSFSCAHSPFLWNFGVDLVEELLPCSWSSIGLISDGSPYSKCNDIRSNWSIKMK